MLALFKKEQANTEAHLLLMRAQINRTLRKVRLGEAVQPDIVESSVACVIRIAHYWAHYATIQIETHEQEEELPNLNYNPTPGETIPTATGPEGRSGDIGSEEAGIPEERTEGRQATA